MAGFRDDFYYKVGQDYYEHMDKSFIYGYVRKEREQNLRLRIKEELFCLADTPVSKGKFTRFLVKSLLTDKNLAAKLDTIGVLGEFVKSAKNVMKDDHAEDTKDCLAHISEYLDRHPVFDIDVDVLRKLTYEFMNTCEFEGEKKNPYVQLTSLYIDMDYGWITEYEYIKGLIDFFMANSKYIPDKSDMSVLQEKAVDVWGKDVFAGIRKSGDKLGRLSELEKTDKGKFERYASALMKKRYAVELAEKVQHDILRVEIKTLLYDAGFSVESGTYRSPRKKEKSMDILDAYFKYVRGNPFSMQGGDSEIPGGYLTWEEYYEACDTLRDTLNSDRGDIEHCDMFMPMWIDREVGGGVFLIGKNKFEESAEVKIYSNCEFGVVYFLGVEDGRAFEFDAFQAKKSERDAFPGMEEAVSWFQNCDYKADSFAEYMACNNNAPDECPDVFLKFFEQPEDLSYDDTITDEDIAETMEEFDNDFEEYKIKKKLRLSRN